MFFSRLWVIHFCVLSSHTVCGWNIFDLNEDITQKPKIFTLLKSSPGMLGTLQKNHNRLEISTYLHLWPLLKDQKLLMDSIKTTKLCVHRSLAEEMEAKTEEKYNKKGKKTSIYNVFHRKKTERQLPSFLSFPHWFVQPQPWCFDRPTGKRAQQNEFTAVWFILLRLSIMFLQVATNAIYPHGKISVLWKVNCCTNFIAGVEEVRIFESQSD